MSGGDSEVTPLETAQQQHGGDGAAAEISASPQEPEPARELSGAVIEEDRPHLVIDSVGDSRIGTESRSRRFINNSNQNLEYFENPLLKDVVGKPHATIINEDGEVQRVSHMIPFDIGGGEEDQQDDKEEDGNMSFRHTLQDTAHRVSRRIVYAEQNVRKAVAAGAKPYMNSKRQVVFLLLSTMIGQGLFNIPEVFSVAGILGAVFSLAVCMSFVWLSLVMLVECGASQSILDYGDLLKKGFPVHGEAIADIVILLDVVGGLLSYTIFIGGTLSEVVQNWGCNGGACDVYFITCFSMFLAVFPITLLRSFGELSRFSLLSVASLVSLVCLVLFVGPFVGDSRV